MRSLQGKQLIIVCAVCIACVLGIVAGVSIARSSHMQTPSYPAIVSVRAAARSSSADDDGSEIFWEIPATVSSYPASSSAAPVSSAASSSAKQTHRTNSFPHDTGSLTGRHALPSSMPMT